MTLTNLVEVLCDGVEVGAVVVLERVQLLDLCLRRVVDPLQRKHLRLGWWDPAGLLVREDAALAADGNIPRRVCRDDELNEDTWATL